MLTNPFYVKPARMGRAGTTTFKEAARVYFQKLDVGMLRMGMVPSDAYRAGKATLDDFAKQMDRQAVIKLKVRK
jgi:hypothetical protein